MFFSRPKQMVATLWGFNFLLHIRLLVLLLLPPLSPPAVSILLSLSTCLLSTCSINLSLSTCLCSLVSINLSAPIRPWSRFKRTCSAAVRRTSFPIHLLGHVLSCKTQHVVDLISLKNAVRARHPSKSDSWRCENEAFVEDFPQKMIVEYVKTKLSCEASLKKWQSKVWDVFVVRFLCCKISWLWDLLAVSSFGCEISWLWDFLAVRSLGCEISWLWNHLAVRSLGCEISWLWDLLAVRSLGCEIPWLWGFLAVRSLGREISLLWDLFVWDLLAVKSTAAIWINLTMFDTYPLPFFYAGLIPLPCIGSQALCLGKNEKLVPFRTLGAQNAAASKRGVLRCAGEHKSHTRTYSVQVWIYLTDLGSKHITDPCGFSIDSIDTYKSKAIITSIHGFLGMWWDVILRHLPVFPNLGFADLYRCIISNILITTSLP